MHNDELPTVYLQIHLLPFSRWPARVRRHRGVTLVWIQPDTLKVQFAYWVKEHLTEQEQVAIRLAGGECADLRIPVRDSSLDGELTMASIPVALRLPSERLALRTA